MSPGKITESVGIRPMQDSDLPFIRLGLSETNWQDIPDDQRKFLKQAETDKRVFDDFERYLRTERYKFTVFVATAANGEQMRYVSAGELTNPAVGLRHGGILDFWVTPKYRERRRDSAS